MKHGTQHVTKTSVMQCLTWASGCRICRGRNPHDMCTRKPKYARDCMFSAQRRPLLACEESVFLYGMGVIAERELRLRAVGTQTRTPVLVKTYEPSLFVSF